MQPADVMDRLTILLLHIIHGNPSVESEFQAVLQEAMRLDPVIGDFILLFTYNRAIWKLEADIRAGKEEKLGLEEVGRRSLAIREYNKERCAAKNKIAERLGGFRQAKIDHASA